MRVQQAPLSQLVDGSKVSDIPLSNTVVAVVISVLLFIHQQIVEEVQCLVDHGYFPAHQISPCDNELWPPTVSERSRMIHVAFEHSLVMAADTLLYKYWDKLFLQYILYKIAHLHSLLVFSFLKLTGFHCPRFSALRMEKLFWKEKTIAHYAQNLSVWVLSNHHGVWSGEPCVDEHDQSPDQERAEPHLQLRSSSVMSPIYSRRDGRVDGHNFLGSLVPFVNYLWHYVSVW